MIRNRGFEVWIDHRNNPDGERCMPLGLDLSAARSLVVEIDLFPCSYSLFIVPLEPYHVPIPNGSRCRAAIPHRFPKWQHEFNRKRGLLPWDATRKCRWQLPDARSARHLPFPKHSSRLRPKMHHGNPNSDNAIGWFRLGNPIPWATGDGPFPEDGAVLPETRRIRFRDPPRNPLPIQPAGPTIPR